MNIFFPETYNAFTISDPDFRVWDKYADKFNLTNRSNVNKNLISLENMYFPLIAMIQKYLIGKFRTRMKN